MSLDEMLESDCKTIAVITKTEKEATALSKKLEKKGVKIKNITAADDKYSGGLCVMSSYLSKGLEFDGVILYNTNEENYCSDNNLDMALLYVSMTRPLHKLKMQLSLYL